MSVANGTDDDENSFKKAKPQLRTPTSDLCPGGGAAPGVAQRIPGDSFSCDLLCIPTCLWDSQLAFPWMLLLAFCGCLTQSRKGAEVAASPGALGRGVCCAPQVSGACLQASVLTTRSRLLWSGVRLGLGVQRQWHGGFKGGGQATQRLAAAPAPRAPLAAAGTHVSALCLLGPLHPTPGLQTCLVPCVVSCSLTFYLLGHRRDHSQSSIFYFSYQSSSCQTHTHALEKKNVLPG